MHDGDDSPEKDDDDDSPLSFGEPLRASPAQANRDSISPPSNTRRLDLDDFANSPAADADDSAADEDEGAVEGEEGHDVEMRVTLG